MSSNENKPKTNLATALGAQKNLAVCSGDSGLVMERAFSSARLSNEAMEASKGPISFCSVGHVVSFCLVEKDEEEEEKEVRLE